MKGLKHIYGGQGGGSRSGASGPKLEGGKDESGFHQNYGDASNRGGPVQKPRLESGGDVSATGRGQDSRFSKGYGRTGPIETLKVGTPLAGSGSLLPSEAEDLGQDPRFYHKYGLVGPIETLEIGSMSPRAKKVRYPHNAKQAAGALRMKEGGY